MGVSKGNGKGSQLQLEGLYQEDNPEGESSDTGSQLSGKKRYEGTNTDHSIDTSRIFDRIVSYENMHRAFSKIARNKGPGGVDGRVISLLYRFVKAEVMENGVKRPTDEGVPQGGPLSPLLSNIMLADAKTRLERLDEWVRHKIRAVILSQNRRLRSRYKLFRQCGANHHDALLVANARQKVWALSGYM